MDMHMEKQLDIKVLSGGCSCCSQLFANTEEALCLLGIDAEPEFSYDIEEALQYEVFQMPALVINGRVVSTGSELSVDRVKKIIQLTIDN